jgi:hypothetical protein
MTEPSIVAEPLPPSGSGAPAGPGPIPARRRRLFDGPLFWIGLILFGLVLAAALSFVPARGDTAANKPDVEAFCAQVDVLGSTDLLSLVAGVATGGVEPGPVSPTTIESLDQARDGVEPDLGSTSTSTTSPFGSRGTELDQLDAIDQRLMALERVAPHEVRTDVHEVRLAVDEVLVALRRSAAAGPIPPTSLLFAVSDAQREMQDAIDRMASYIQDTCGIDVRNPGLQPNPFGR